VLELELELVLELVLELELELELVLSMSGPSRRAITFPRSSPPLIKLIN
jgi:hypothetical protein